LPTATEIGSSPAAKLIAVPNDHDIANRASSNVKKDRKTIF